MPFWLHEHKYVLFCKGQPLRYKFFTAGAILGLLGFGWCIGIFTPWQKDLNQKQRTHASLLEQKKIFEPVVTQYHCCCEKYYKLKQTYASLSQEWSLQHITSNLLARMHQNSIACGGIAQGQTIDKRFYQRHELTFRCKGAYHNLLTFLKMIDESKLPIECRTVSLHKKKNRSLSCKLQVRIVSAKEERA